MKHILVCALAASFLLAGCASEPQASADEGYARSDREYSTGSNIPRKRGEKTEGVSTYDREAVQRARDAAHQAPRPGLGGSP